MIKQLIKLANHLDSKGLGKEADYLDAVITKLSRMATPELGECIEDVDEEAYYAQNLFKMLEGIEEEQGEEEDFALDLTNS